jgi:hypothetical protein
MNVVGRHDTTRLQGICVHCDPDTGKAKKSGVDVAFAAGVLDTGAGQLAGAAVVVDARIEDHYKETVRQICQAIRVADQFTEQKYDLLKRPGVSRAEVRPA